MIEYNELYRIIIKFCWTCVKGGVSYIKLILKLKSAAPEFTRFEQAVWYCDVAALKPTEVCLIVYDAVIPQKFTATSVEIPYPIIICWYLL
jgi:hypothetical protein